MIDRARESRNPKKVIRVTLMESYGEIGRVPVNLYSYGEYALVGTKGYCYEGKDTIEHFEKLRSREIERLRVFLEMAKKAGYQKFTGMIFVENETKDVLCFFML